MVEIDGFDNWSGERLFAVRTRVWALLVYLAASACPSLAGAQLPSFCGMPFAANNRVVNLEIAAHLEYGNSLHELALYRLLRGVDNELLPRELIDLAWFNEQEARADWSRADDPRTSQFQQLLIPRES